MTGLRELRRRVEHVDTDAAGVVHFTRYASLLETAVLENLERLGVGVRHMAAQGLDLVVRDLRMRYAASARFFDQVRVEVRVDRVAGATCEMSGEIRREPEGAEPATLLAAGTLVFCMVDRADGAAAPLPSELRRTLRDCLNGDRDE